MVMGAVTMLAVGLTPESAFVSAPRSVIVAIDSLTRLDMIDYYNSGSTVASRNSLGGESSVTELSKDAITVATSRSSQVTIALLPSGKRDTVLMVINTLALPVADSFIEMYDRNWNRLSSSKYEIPSHNNLKMWLQPQSKGVTTDIENHVPFISALYTYSDCVLRVTNTLSRLLPREEYDEIKDYLKSEICYRWTGGKWTRVK